MAMVGVQVAVASTPDETGPACYVSFINLHLYKKLSCFLLYAVQNPDAKGLAEFIIFAKLQSQSGPKWTSQELAKEKGGIDPSWAVQQILNSADA